MNKKAVERCREGLKNQLLIDRAVLEEVKAMKRNLNMCWIDYKKAYDMVPHSWILKMLDTVGVADNIRNLLSNSMRDWKTVLTSNNEVLGDVDIKRGIFQGDSFSPLLFVIIMIPLSMLLRRESLGYSFGPDGRLINHLLFMDDLNCSQAARETSMP